MLKHFFASAVLLYCAAESRLEEPSLQFVAEYFAYKGTHVITTFACSSRGILLAYFCYTSTKIKDLCRILFKWAYESDNIQHE
jgi:hypothetical protein